jgi:Ca-activated chloride channel family protein
MSFIWPALLILLLLIPLAGWLYVRLQRRRSELVAHYGGMGLLQTSAGQRLGRRRHIPPALFLIGLSILLIAVARPQATVSLPRAEGTVILAFDVSGSMAATDLQPTRMEAAKAAARAFVDRQPPSIRIGVVAFSDSGLLIQSPTYQQADVLAAIGRIAPQRGTSLGQGVLAALNVIAGEAEQPQLLYSNREPSAAPTPAPLAGGRYESSVIVLITDGENTAPPEPQAIAQLAAERGVRIHTVGIGSPAGTTLTVNGFNVYTQLDEPTLQQIAQITAGDYYNAASSQDLQAIYENLDLQLLLKAEKIEITALFAGLGLLALLVGGICSLIWFGRVP